MYLYILRLYLNIAERTLWGNHRDEEKRPSGFDVRLRQ